VGSILLVDNFSSQAASWCLAGNATASDSLSLLAGWLTSLSWLGVPLLLGEASALESFFQSVWHWVLIALGLGFVIFVHELGHFLAAKTFGVRCDKFYVGFDVPISIGPIKFPRTLGKFQWGETEYGIGIIPLGGYVKMLGQDDDPRNSAEEAEKIRQGEGEEAPLDPRSFPAKAVWQRMIIISAGVVMNLIFAVFLAAGAYGLGVPFTPTIAGGSLAGGPAWEAGIEAGDQVVKFGGMEEPDSQLRYQDFAVGVAMQGFETGDEPIPVTLIRDGREIELEIRPSNKLSPEGKVYRIGMLPPTKPVIGSVPYIPFSYLGQLEPDIQPDDVVTGVDGQPLPEHSLQGQPLGSEVTAAFQAKYRESIRLNIERPAAEPKASPERLEVELPPVPVKSLGFGFQPGPVTAVRSGSIAGQAGLQVGDVIEAVNGEPVVDGLRLPDRVASLAGEEITLTVRRSVGLPSSSSASANTSDEPASEAAEGEGDASDSDRGPSSGESTDQTTELEGDVVGNADNQQAGTGEQQLELTFQNVDRATFDPIGSYYGRLTLGGIGVAFTVEPIVSTVSEELGDRVQVGDELLQIHWRATDQQRKEAKSFVDPRAFEEQLIDKAFNIPCLYDQLQSFPEGASVKCFFRRNGQTVDTECKVTHVDDWYWYQRGVALTQMLATYQSRSFTEAMSLGFVETYKRFGDVLYFLRLLVTGRIGASGVGGPIAIAGAASSEATFGVARLMLFLTLLSANLAIINFLPIPALDGGHMVFLTAEAIQGRPVSEALQIRLTMAGVLGLLGLMAFVIFNDIMRLL
jgi:regulator of sigma E protease